jgi:hypothetical protein
LRVLEMEHAHSKLAATNAENEQNIARLREEAKPRTISPAQGSRIAGLLRAFSGQLVNVRVYSQENEAQVFAKQIIQTLEEAGMVVNLTNVMGPTGQGLSILVHDQQSAPPLAGTIQHAFGAAGIRIDGAVNSHLVPTSGEFVIAVGAKPIPH